MKWKEARVKRVIKWKEARVKEVMKWKKERVKGVMKWKEARVKVVSGHNKIYAQFRHENSQHMLKGAKCASSDEAKFY